MRIYIDTNTFPASPALYADAEKTKPLPRIIPAVELQRGGFEIAFIGSNQPQDIATCSLVASIENSQTQVVAELGEETSDGEAWRFDFALNSGSLVAEVANRGSARLRVGVIVEDDTERREWQFNTVVYPTASSGETDVEAVESAKDWAELAGQSAERAQESKDSAIQSAESALSSKIEAEEYAKRAQEYLEEVRETDQKVEQKVSLLKTNPVTFADDCSDGYGYRGTLRALGAFGDAVQVESLSVKIRSDGTLNNADVSLWARILKNVSGAWVVAAQSETSRKWNEVDPGSFLAFKMVAVDGVVPPNADEEIAIVFINSASAAASVSNGALGFDVTFEYAGGLAGELATDPATAQTTKNWSPIFRLAFAAMTGGNQLATKADLDAKADAVIWGYQKHKGDTSVTTLDDLSQVMNCYQMYMGTGITKLTQDFDLPQAYTAEEMFRDCTALTSAGIGYIYSTKNNSCLKNTKGMFRDCTALRYVELGSFFNCSTDESYAFYGCTELTYLSVGSNSEDFVGNFHVCKSNGNYFACGCSKLTTIYGRVGWTTAIDAFKGCSALKNVFMEFDCLEFGTGLFRECSMLTTVYSDLSSLKKGISMFRDCSALTIFDADLSSLENPYAMFENCSALKTFSNDLPHATDGSSMFKGCSALTDFTSKIPRLKNGWSMFENAGLTAESISNVLNSLPTWTDGATHKITFTGCPGASELTQESESVAAALAKGWTVEL